MPDGLLDPTTTVQLGRCRAPPNDAVWVSRRGMWPTVHDNKVQESCLPPSVAFAGEPDGRTLPPPLPPALALVASGRPHFL